MRKQKPLWSPYVHGVTQGFLDTWLTCREQARLKYLDGWAATLDSEPILFGDCFHFLLEQSPTIERPVTLTRNWIAHKKAEAVKLSAAQQDTLTEIAAIAAVVAKHYPTHWQRRDKNIHWIAQERVFKTSISGFLAPIPITGRMDGVLYDKRGGLWLFETKTKKRIDEDGLQESLPFNLQNLLYCWALRNISGVCPEGILYNVVRRPGIYRRKNEELGDYCTRVSDDILARPDDYYYTWQVSLLPGDLDAFERDFLRPVLENVEFWYNSLQDIGVEGNPHHYLTPGALLTPFGRSSMFDLVTQKRTRGFHRREVPFPELRLRKDEPVWQKQSDFLVEAKPVQALLPNPKNGSSTASPKKTTSPRKNLVSTRSVSLGKKGSAKAHSVRSSRAHS